MRKELLTICAVLVAAGGLPLLAEQLDTGPADGPRTLAFEHRGGSFLPGADGEVELFPGHPELDDRYSEEMIIRMAYGSLEEALRRSGHLVSISVGDFATHYRRDFGKVLVRELMTLHAPRRLEVRRTEVTGPEGDTIGRTYTPGWSGEIGIEDLDDVRAFRDHYWNMTVAQALRQPDAGELERMIAVTSYRVTVEFEGEREEYRAAFKWIPAPGGAASFIVEDHVTDAVSRALLEAGGVAPLAVLLDRGRDGSANRDDEARR